MAKKLVVDACVAAKWFLNDEDDVDLASDILESFLAEDIELHAPRIFTYEVCALISKAHGTKKGGVPRISDKDAVTAVEALFQVPVQIQEDDKDEEIKSLNLSMIFAKTFKDMTYLNLAQNLDCAWCTADSKLLKANRPTFPAKWVVRMFVPLF